MECFTIAALFCTALHNMQCTYYTSTQKVQLFGYQMVSKFKPANLKGSPWSEESPQAGVDLGGWTLLTFCHSWKERVAVWSIFCLKFYWGVALVAVACGGIVVFFANNLLVFFTLFAWLKSVAPLFSVWWDRASPWDPFICCVILFFSLGNPSLKVVFWGLASVACTEPLLSVWRDRANPWDANQRVQEGERGRK